MPPPASTALILAALCATLSGACARQATPTPLSRPEPRSADAAAPAEVAPPPEIPCSTDVGAMQLRLHDQLKPNLVVSATAPISGCANQDAYDIVAVGVDYITDGFAWDQGEETWLDIYQLRCNAQPTLLQQYTYSGARIERMEVINPPGSTTPLLIVQAHHLGGTWDWSTLACFEVDVAACRIRLVSEEYFAHSDMRWYDDLWGRGPAIAVWIHEPKWNDTPDTPWLEETLILTGWSGEGWGHANVIPIPKLLSEAEAKEARSDEDRWETVSHHLRNDPVWRPTKSVFRLNSDLRSVTSPSGNRYVSNLFERGGWKESLAPAAPIDQALEGT